MFATDPDEAVAWSLVERVCARSGVSVPALMAKGRTARLVATRHVAMYLARNLTDLSLPRLGQIFHRDHTCVLHAVRRVAANPALLEPAREMMRELGIVDTCG